MTTATKPRSLPRTNWNRRCPPAEIRNWPQAVLRRRVVGALSRADYAGGLGRDRDAENARREAVHFSRALIDPVDLTGLDVEPAGAVCQHCGAAA